MSREWNNLMIDLETLGTEPGEAILSIAAVKFNQNGEVKETFKRNIDIEDSERNGFKINAAMLKWWLDNKYDVLKEQTADAQSSYFVLIDFLSWLKDIDDYDQIWAKSPSFDCKMLSAFIKRVGTFQDKVGTSFRKWRDIRTLVSTAEQITGTKVDIKEEFKEVHGDREHHDPVGDCLYQIMEYKKAMELLKNFN